MLPRFLPLSFLRRLKLRAGGLFLRRSRENELNRELQFHFDMLVEENLRAGLSPAEARYAAQREFGAASVYREECRDTWRPPALSDLWRSLRFAVRSLARTPGFTFIAIVTIALGVGANTSMFSLLNTVLLKPLPYPGGETLDRIYRVTAQNPQGAISTADYLDLRPEMAGYGEIAA